MDLDVIIMAKKKGECAEGLGQWQATQRSR